MGNMIEVSVTRLVDEKMYAWTQIAEGEVSGLGLAKTWSDDDGIFHIHADKLWLFEQECTAGSTDIHSHPGAKYANRAAQMDRGNDMRFWWHSHVNMETYWSSTDEEQIESTKMPGAFLSIVTNKQGDRRVRVDFTPYPEDGDLDNPHEKKIPEFKLDNLDMSIRDYEIREELKEKYDEKVTQKTRNVTVAQSVRQIHKNKKKGGKYFPQGGNINNEWRKRRRSKRKRRNDIVEENVRLSPGEDFDDVDAEYVEPDWPRGQQEAWNFQEVEDPEEFFNPPEEVEQEESDNTTEEVILPANDLLEERQLEEAMEMAQNDEKAELEDVGDNHLMVRYHGSIISLSQYYQYKVYQDESRDISPWIKG